MSEKMELFCEFVGGPQHGMRERQAGNCFASSMAILSGGKLSGEFYEPIGKLRYEPDGSIVQVYGYRIEPDVRGNDWLRSGLPVRD